MDLELWQLDLKYAALRIADPAHAARMLAALCAHGQCQPVLVVAGDAPDRYVLLDGYARVAALTALKRDTVAATVLAVPEAEALVLASRLGSGRARSALEEGWLLRVLVRDHGVAPAALAAALGRSPSWVSRRLALVEGLPAAAEAAVRTGQVAPQAAMKCLVPLARANAAHCTALLANCAGRRLTVREVVRLYAGWRAGTADQRARLVAAPLLYLALEAAEEDAAAPPPPDPGAEREQRVVRDLGALAAIARRVRVALTQREAALPWPAVLRYAWQDAQASVAALVAVVGGDGHA